MAGLVAPVAEPGDLQRLRVVLVVHPHRLVLVGDAAVLARPSLELAAREVDVGVGPGPVTDLLVLGEWVVFAPLSHVGSVALGTPCMVSTMGLAAFRAGSDHGFTITAEAQVKGMFIVEPGGNRATDSRLRQGGRRVLVLAGPDSFLVGTSVRVFGFVCLDTGIGAQTRMICVP